MATKVLTAFEGTSVQPAAVAESRRRITAEGISLLVVAGMAAFGAMMFLSGFGWDVFAIAVAANGLAYLVPRLVGLMMERRDIRRAREQLHADSVDLDRAISSRLRRRG